MDKSASNSAGEQEENSGAETGQEGAAQLSRRRARQVDLSWPLASAEAPAPASTPLQRLLDPAQSLLGRSARLQDKAHSGLNLPAWNNLQTYEVRSGTADSGLPESGFLAPAPLQPTLDESVVEGLIQALYEALPTDLTEPAQELLARPEKTVSGNLLGRHPSTLSAASTAWARPAESKVPARPPELTPPAPRQFIRGNADEAALRVARESLSTLDLGAPADDSAQRLSVQTTLGAGEACFLRAQSALWTWRTHRQPNLQLHTDGPPSLSRNALIEQRIGPVTLLIGCRVTHMTEQSRSWGFTMDSLSGQVLRSHESFLVEWQDNNSVVFTCTSQQQIAASSLAFLGPVHLALRRVMLQGYVRHMTEMSADADDYP